MPAIDDLPPLRDVVSRHKLNAVKSLGQNFLMDLNLTEKIARSAGNLEGRTILEIGPGPGGLTRALLANGAAKVIAVERDERCLPALREIEEHYPGRLDIIEGDALKVEFGPLVEGRKAKIVANLPYNIGTALLIGWLLAEPWPPYFSSLTLMFQKEVAKRIVAPPGSGDYGRLSILGAWRTEAKIVFDVPPQAFTPPPKVTSSVVHMTPREKPLPCSADVLSQVTQAAFGQRRKMLRQSLKRFGGEALLADCGIDPSRRAETLTIVEFCRLAQRLEQLR
ncbi:MAG: 16S rRNA (adenine(1518)-N(6)/adenine(1519)-N(6))-dimethyltransferase RsmA [Pseudomonadota bacterium]